jgi:sigma-B regulation protein RsbU (phosphoserine phosphatase)
MLDLQDFFHLPEVDTLVSQLADDAPGLIVVAGLDPATPADASGFLPSGRAAIFRILMRHIMLARPARHVIVVATSKDAVRIPRHSQRQVEWALVEPPHTYSSRIAYAISRRPDLLVIDPLDAETAGGALTAAQNGLVVLSQLDTVFNGASVARHLLDLDVPRELLNYLTWIVTVQRVQTLCPKCKQPETVIPARWEELRHRFPNVPLQGTFFRAGRCAECDHTGRHGNVAAFDIFRAAAGPVPLVEQPSVLPLEEYLLRLATLGHVPLSDVVGFAADQLRRAYGQLAASERALAEANATLESKLAQLEAANRVLQHRTEAIVSLQDIGQTLVTLADLDDLATRVCRHVRDLCGADRAILYYLRPDGTAEVLAVYGWPGELMHRHLDAAMVMGAGGPLAASAEPTTFAGPPPGVAPSRDDALLRAGLRVPLIAQQEVVGLMIVQTTLKPAFSPGEVAMLQAFANQAAVAIQRGGLVDSLQDKIEQLEAAQVELARTERLERELELARQVQQRLLPRTFPLTPGFAFAARCEPARRVGGDFYDVILLDADRFGVVIADVSDKGMPAALFMALTRSLLLAESRRERSPRAVLANVHRLLLELGEPDMFVTVFYGVVDVSSRQLTYARAGHDRPMLLRAGTIQSLGGTGTMLGCLDPDQLNLSEEQVELVSGDRLVLYTDGLADAVNPQLQLFGMHRVSALAQSLAGRSADEMCAGVFEGVAAYQGAAEQFDDMTLLVVEVK